MKKLLLAAVAVFGLLAVPSNAAAEQKKSDKPKSVTVKCDTSKGYIEVTVVAERPTKKG